MRMVTMATRTVVANMTESGLSIRLSRKLEGRRGEIGNLF